MQSNTDMQKCMESKPIDASNMTRQKCIQSDVLVQADTDLHVSPLALLPLGCLLGIAQPFGGGPFKGIKVSLVAGQLAAV